MSSKELFLICPDRDDAGLYQLVTEDGFMLARGIFESPGHAFTQWISGDDTPELSILRKPGGYLFGITVCVKYIYDSSDENARLFAKNQRNFKGNEEFERYTRDILKLDDKDAKMFLP